MIDLGLVYPMVLLPALPWMVWMHPREPLEDRIAGALRGCSKVPREEHVVVAIVPLSLLRRSFGEGPFGLGGVGAGGVRG